MHVSVFHKGLVSGHSLNCVYVLYVHLLFDADCIQHVACEGNICVKTQEVEITVGSLNIILPTHAAVCVLVAYVLGCVHEYLPISCLSLVLH